MYVLVRYADVAIVAVATVVVVAAVFVGSPSIVVSCGAGDVVATCAAVDEAVFVILVVTAFVVGVLPSAILRSLFPVAGKTGKHVQENSYVYVCTAQYAEP